MRTWLVIAAVLIAWIGWGADEAFAQNATVTGAVKDASGGVVPGATVTARNQETGLSRVTFTDVGGNYRLPALPPGTYAIGVELTGFSSESRRDLVLVIDQTAIINFTLKLATLQESLTVTGESPVVDTTRSDVATNISSAQIQDLPVASRRWIDLALLVPGTSQDGIRGQFYRGNANLGGGTREYSNAFLVDGVSNTWAEMGEARQNFPMDSIREFKVSTSTYKAEQGLATGGVLTVVSKSGTNDLRGSGFLFFRDKSLTSKTVFEEVKPPFKRYQYGGSIGGPIVKDKTHFFFAYERTDENLFFTVATRGVWPQYDGTYGSDQNRWTYNSRIDHQISQKQSLFFRFASEDEYRPIATAGGNLAPTGSFDLSFKRSALAVGHTWILNDRTLNDIRLQIPGYAKYILSPPYSHGNWGPGDFPQDRVSAFTPRFLYPSITFGNSDSQMGPEYRWQFKEDFSYLMHDLAGTHQWKMGVDYNYITFRADGSSGYAGEWTFPRDQPYNASDPTTWPTQYLQRQASYADTPVHHFSAYVQDDWEPKPGLIFNLGLRWDVQPGVFNEDIQGRLALIEKKLGPGFGYPLPIPFHAGADKRGDWNNFGPRTGVAWDPSGHGTLNVHAAYGMFYDNIRTLTTDFTELNWPQAQQIIIRNPSFPDPLQGRSRTEFLSTAPPNITVLANDFVNPYAHQVNAGWTQMLTRDIAVTADATAVYRYSDRDIVDPNVPDPVTRLRTYPQFSRVSFSQSTANNTYKALLVKLEKRLSKGYQFLASYTLSKAEDSSIRNVLADVYGFTRVKSPAQADRRHRLVVSGIVQLPLDMQVSAIADFRSSLPFDPQTSFDLNGDGYTNDDPPGVGYYSGCRGLSLDAVNAFRVARRLSSVTSIACPGYANLDLRFSKAFTMSRSHRLEFIAQLFNVSNRANLARPVNNPTSNLFGQTTQLLPFILNAPSRQVELAIRYQF